MKATDLMVGDWFKAIDYNAPFRITAIYNDVVQTQADYQSEIDGNWYSEAEIKDLVPIELTEEILAKNFGGYDHIDYDKEGRLPCYFVGNRQIFVGSVMDKGRCFYFCHKDDWAGLHDIEIHYVHQLQHLMRLCNIDKEISI